MWLLNARSRQLEYFHDAAAVHQGYAILSHVWSSEEVTYQDLTCLDSAKSKKGYCKLDSTCRRALEDGFAYVWIDTCCIDKTSSAELSEAINSMFNWYKRSAICYAYLEDISVAVDSSQRGSRWFTRGWTLQELIAPSRMDFYDRDWHYIGNKDELCSKLERHTGIPEYILLDCGYLDTVSVAKKMSWASTRQTTRPEDMSYCLLGIFDVNMPLLYGEGKKAFHRLLEAIMRRTTDHSILVWQPSMETTGPMAGLLASGPADYSNSGRVMQYSDRIPDAYELNNVGIRMNMPMFSDHGQHYILLDCRYEDDFSGIIGLEVKLISAHTDVTDGLMILRRRRGVRLFDIEQSGHDLLSLRTQILLVPYDYMLKGKTEERCHGLKIWLQQDSRSSEILKVSEAWPPPRWNPMSQVLSWPGTMVPCSDIREGYLLLVSRYVTNHSPGRDLHGRPVLLLLFANRFKTDMGLHQECLFKAIGLRHHPSRAEIEAYRQSGTHDWTAVDKLITNVHCILSFTQVFQENIKVAVTRQNVMATPVYIIRLSCDSTS